jgi:hypothetical protein
MDADALIRQRTVPATVTVWGLPRPTAPGTLLFFPNEYLYRAADGTITQVGVRVHKAHRGVWGSCD